MKRSTTLFLKVVILLIAIVVLAGMIRFPQIEGRAANLDLTSIYTDPFIIYLYIASIPFFFGLHQAFKFLNFIEANKVFSQGAVNKLRNIKYAAIAFLVFMIGALLNIFVMSKATNDDGAGAMMVGFIIIVASAVIATAAAVFQKRLQKRLM